MKKITILVFTFLLVFAAYAQDEETQINSATKKGNILFEVGTSVFGENTIKQGNSTGFSLFSSDGTTVFSIGAEGGYFITDNTALKLGFGFTDLDQTDFLTYKFGFKHYAGGNIPIQLDITGATNEDIDTGFGSL